MWKGLDTLKLEILAHFRVEMNDIQRILPWETKNQEQTQTYKQIERGKEEQKKDRLRQDLRTQRNPSRRSRRPELGVAASAMGMRY